MKNRQWRNFLDRLTSLKSDQNFLYFTEKFESAISKVLSMAMIFVIIVSTYDLIVFLIKEMVAHPFGFQATSLIEILGLFLNLLIALELLENITAYLKEHVIQVELVIVTSLIAVARKIIIFDFEKASDLDLIGLGVAIFSLSLSYWIIRRMNSKKN
jgi:uncharacterized membrane protein (DUF373 family)